MKSVFTIVSIVLAVGIAITPAFSYAGERPWGNFSLDKKPKKSSGHIGKYNPWIELEEKGQDKSSYQQFDDRYNPWGTLDDTPTYSTNRDDKSANRWRFKGDSDWEREQELWDSKSDSNYADDGYERDFLNKKKRYLFSDTPRPQLHESVRPIPREREVRSYRPPVDDRFIYDGFEISNDYLRDYGQNYQYYYQPKYGDFWRY